jgi:hypothetical protein
MMPEKREENQSTDTNICLYRRQMCRMNSDRYGGNGETIRMMNRERKKERK